MCCVQYQFCELGLLPSLDYSKLLHYGPSKKINKSTNLFDVCSLFNFVVDHLIKEFDWFSPDFIIVHEGYWHVWIQIIFIIRDFLWFQNIPFFQKKLLMIEINRSSNGVHLTLRGKISEIFGFENLDWIRLVFPAWNSFYSTRARWKPKNLATKM